MKNIPKIVHFVWTTGSPMSRLQYYSLLTFSRLNPEWKVIIHLIKQTVGEIGRNTFVPDYTGRDYFDCVKSHKKAQIHEVDLDEEGIGRDKHGILVSDILRLKYLYEMGGVYSDFDMLWLKPMEEFGKISRDFETTLCRYTLDHRIHYNASNIVSEPGGGFLRMLLDYQKTIQPPYTHQAFNTDMLNKLFPGFPDREFPRLLNLPYEVFYPYSIFELDKLYHATDLSPIQETTMGIHWFNGHRLSREYVDENIEAFVRPCSMTKILTTLITGEL